MDIKCWVFCSFCHPKEFTWLRYLKYKAKIDINVFKHICSWGIHCMSCHNTNVSISAVSWWTINIIPSKHTTLFQRPCNVHNVETTSYRRQNNVACTYWVVMINVVRIEDNKYRVCGSRRTTTLTREFRIDYISFL